MRVLVLTPQPLAPIDDGLNLRVVHLFRELARTHDVRVLALTEGTARSAVADSAFAEVRTVAIRGPMEGSAFRHCRDYAVEAERAAKAWLREWPADVVAAASIYMAPYAARLAPPVVVDLVDAASLLAWRSVREAATWRLRARQLKAWLFWRRWERRNLPAFPRLVVSSAQDASVVRRRAPLRTVDIIENGVDAAFFRPIDAGPRNLEIVFTGVMGYPPNDMAARYFYREIFPAVRSAVPGVRLTLAGRGPTEALRGLVAGDQAVTLTGFVDDLRPCIARAAVYVAPMVSGAGIKNKILEAWAMARPVIATPMACGSLDGVPGTTHIVADTPRRFADEVIRLLRDPVRGDAIGEQARRLVLDRYQWGAQAERFGRILEETAKAPWPAARREP